MHRTQAVETVRFSAACQRPSGGRDACPGPQLAAAAPAATGRRWSAGLGLGFRPSGGKTVLAHRRRYGPLAVQRPFYPEGGVCHVYLLHPPGGLVGGDLLEIHTHLATHSHALVTTPGATKFYRSAGAMAQQTQRLEVADGATLEWLPRENIFFPGAQAALCTRVELQGRARLALWETHCLGRPVIGEAFDAGRVDTRLELYRDGVPLLLERLRVDARSRLWRSRLDGRAVTATALFSHAGDHHLRLARDCIGTPGNGIAAATRVEDLLLLRYLGDSAEEAQDLFAKTWSALREPLLNRPATSPRIWNT